MDPSDSLDQIEQHALDKIYDKGQTCPYSMSNPNKLPDSTSSNVNATQVKINHDEDRFSGCSTSNSSTTRRKINGKNSSFLSAIKNCSYKGLANSGYEKFEICIKKK
jgi:hypothetical protein